jgi:hypothetical protein
MTHLALCKYLKYRIHVHIHFTPFQHQFHFLRFMTWPRQFVFSFQESLGLPSLNFNYLICIPRKTGPMLQARATYYYWYK